MLTRCRAERRDATGPERAVLARWSGWGALPAIFDASSRDLRRQAERVEELLSPTEWEAARASTINAQRGEAGLDVETGAALLGARHQPPASLRPRRSWRSPSSGSAARSPGSTS